MLTTTFTWSGVDEVCRFNATNLPASLFDTLALEQHLTFEKLLKPQMIVKKLESKASGVIHHVNKFNASSFK